MSARVDQFTAARRQLSVVQPVRPAAAGGWLAGRKSSAADDDNLDRLVEINSRRLDDRGVLGTALRRGPATQNVAPSSAVYGRAKLLPVTNNVAKPFSTGRNY